MTRTDDFVAFESKVDLQTAAAEWIEQRLTEAIARRGHASFLCAGGRTPAPIYAELSQTEIDWSAVTIGLTDERWVDEDHPASNSAMVRKTLLNGAVTEATYIPMKLPIRDAFEAVEEVNHLYADMGVSDVMLLGMGPDAHTLSWFEGGKGYDQAVDPLNTSLVAAVEAIESDVTGPNTTRMTLTQRCVANSRNVLLLITGREKRKVFERADPGTALAIMRRAAGQSLTVFYSD